MPQNRAGGIGFLPAYKNIIKYNTHTMAKRELELKEQFNEFFRNHNVDNLYDQLSVEEMIKLKKVVSCINNIITIGDA